MKISRIITIESFLECYIPKQEKYEVYCDITESTYVVELLYNKEGVLTDISYCNGRTFSKRTCKN